MSVKMLRRIWTAPERLNNHIEQITVRELVNDRRGQESLIGDYQDIADYEPLDEEDYGHNNEHQKEID